MVSLNKSLEDARQVYNDMGRDLPRTHSQELTSDRDYQYGFNQAQSLKDKIQSQLHRSVLNREMRRQRGDSSLERYLDTSQILNDTNVEIRTERVAMFNEPAAGGDGHENKQVFVLDDEEKQMNDRI